MSQEKSLFERFEEDVRNTKVEMIGQSESFQRVLMRISARYWKNQQIKDGVADAIQTIRKQDKELGLY